MINVVPFEMEHIEQLFPKLRDHDAQIMELHGGQDAIRKMFHYMVKVGVINTFICEDEVIAIWMFLQKWPGVAQCHAWTGKGVDRMPKEFWRACQRGLESAQEAIGLHRLEAYVRADNPYGYRWLTRLGFNVEGLLSQHDVDKVDAYLLGRTW